MNLQFQKRFSQIFATSKRLIEFKAGSCENKEINFVKPEVVSVKKWKNLLWVAMDMKKIIKSNNRECLNLLREKHVTMLFEKPHGRFQIAFTLACSLLGARKTFFCEANFVKQPSPGDLGKALAQLTNMFVTHGIHQDTLIQLTSKITVPVFPASCNVHSLLKVLSDLMTLYEKFNRLKGLTLAWIGPPIPIFNTYLFLCPQFGINVRYLCICIYGSGKMSPVKKIQEDKSNKVPKEVMKEFKSVVEVATGSNIIATSMHPEGRSQITLESLKDAARDWVFLHTLPRSLVEVSDDVFDHENNLSWATSENYLYVAMAVILTSLREYQPTMKMPNFDGN